MKRFIEFLLGMSCRHRRTSLPMTVRKKAPTVQCWDCGRTLDYDWVAMKIVANSQPDADAVMVDAEARQ